MNIKLCFAWEEESWIRSSYKNSSSSLNVIVSEDASMQLMDANGRLVMEKSNLNAYEKNEFNTQSLAKGIYMLKIYNNNIVSMKKVVIQ